MPPILHELRTNKTPPTFNRTNKFTEGFQTIMDSYGIATYQEVNPGLFAVVTFPFLFAVMFGDIGHGFITFAFALGLIMFERKLVKVDLGEVREILPPLPPPTAHLIPRLAGCSSCESRLGSDPVLGINSRTNSGRYIILLMGAFAIYTGLIYNDIFSKTLHLFHSGWDFPVNGTVGAFNGYIYPFGLDPGWHGASNTLIFTNSYKMKMSIVIGVIHVSTVISAFRKPELMPQKMTFALCLQVPNHLKFRNYSDIWTNFVPQMLFLQSIFGYLVVCILYKWSVDWSKSSTSPPSLLNMLIDMFLSPGAINPDEQLYAGQGFVQTILLLIAAVCVPWLLCAKPYLQWKEMKRIHEQGYVGLSGDHDPRRTSSDDTLEAEEEGDGRAIAEDMEEEHVG